MTADLFVREALPQLEALRNFALNLCRDEQKSRDLVQETMLKACTYFHTYAAGTNCRAWLFQICKNSYINEYRRKQLEPVTVDFQEEAAGHNSWSDAGADFGHGRMLADETSSRQHLATLGDEVTQALDAIPAAYQTALILSDIEGYTYEEVSEFMRVPIGTIRSRIHRGRKMLEERLSGYARQEGYYAQ